MSDGSSVLLGLEGLVVDQIGAGGGRDVRVFTAADWAGRCPACRIRSSRSKGWVVTRPRDVKVGPDVPNLLWCKQRRVCTNLSCERRQFTESVPQIPPRARFTVRAKQEMAVAVLNANRTVKEAAAAYRASWNNCHDAVAAMADEVLAAEPDPVTACQRRANLDPLVLIEN